VFQFCFVCVRRFPPEIKIRRFGPRCFRPGIVFARWRWRVHWLASQVRRSPGAGLNQQKHALSAMMFAPAAAADGMGTFEYGSGMLVSRPQSVYRLKVFTFKACRRLWSGHIRVQKGTVAAPHTNLYRVCLVFTPVDIVFQGN